MSKVPEVEFPYVDPRGTRVPWRMIITVKKPKELCEFLDKNGIKTVRTFYPLHLQPCYNISGNFPNSLAAYGKILRLPSATALSKKEVRYVCDKIKLYFKNEGKI